MGELAGNIYQSSFMKISAKARENLITGRRTTILKGHQALEHRKENQAKDSLSE